MSESAEFEEFWSFWPKKVKKQAARDALRWALQHFNADGQLIERMRATVEWQVRFYGGAKWMADPEKWILGQRWEDEEPEPERVVPTARERADYRMWCFSLGPLAQGTTLDAWVKRQRERVA
jgi:hypothetical protein